MSYSQIEWLPLCGGLTILGLIASWVVWRRRGAGAGLRWVAWSLLPMAAYLTHAVRMLWQIGSAIGSFAASFIFSPQVWAGVALTGLAIVLFVVSGTIRGRTRKPGAAGADVPAGKAAQPAGAPAGKALKPAKSKAPAVDDDLGDVADILRKHGIR
ncbi:MAG: cellulose synthase [Streptosporangiaceae bacterium]